MMTFNNFQYQYVTKLRIRVAYPVDLFLLNKIESKHNLFYMWNNNFWPDIKNCTVHDAKNKQLAIFFVWLPNFFSVYSKQFERSSCFCFFYIASQKNLLSFFVTIVGFLTSAVKQLLLSFYHHAFSEYKSSKWLLLF